MELSELGVVLSICLCGPCNYSLQESSSDCDGMLGRRLRDAGVHPMLGFTAVAAWGRHTKVLINRLEAVQDSATHFAIGSYSRNEKALSWDCLQNCRRVFSSG